MCYEFWKLLMIISECTRYFKSFLHLTCIALYFWVFRLCLVFHIVQPFSLHKFINFGSFSIFWVKHVKFWLPLCHLHFSLYFRILFIPFNFFLLPSIFSSIFLWSIIFNYIFVFLYFFLKCYVNKSFSQVHLAVFDILDFWFSLCSVVFTCQAVTSFLVIFHL